MCLFKALDWQKNIVFRSFTPSRSSPIGLPSANLDSVHSLKKKIVKPIQCPNANAFHVFFSDCLDMNMAMPTLVSVVSKTPPNIIK